MKFAVILSKKDMAGINIFNKINEKAPEISPERLVQFRKLFEERLEDLVTSPSGRFVSDIEDFEKVKNGGGKLDRRNKNLLGAFHAAVQDMRLTPEETDILIEMFFE